MRSKESPLSVPEKVRAVIRLQQADSPTAKISVSQVCRLAKVSRANIYSNHPELLAEMQGVRAEPRHNLKVKPPSPTACATCTQLERRNRALLLTVLELRLQLESLQVQAGGRPRR